MTQVASSHACPDSLSLSPLCSHPGSFDIVHVKDRVGHMFATRLANVTVIGEGENSLVSLPRGGDVKLSILEERQKWAKKQNNKH